MLAARRSAQLTAEESIAKEALLEECLKDPGYRDRLSILGRTFDHRKQVHTYLHTYIHVYMYVCMCMCAHAHDIQCVFIMVPTCQLL